MQAYNRGISIPGAIIVAGALIAFGIYWSGREVIPTSNNQAAPVASENTGIIAPIGAEDHVIGDRRAPIVIVEYSDIECPFCKQFHQTLRQLMSTYGVNGQLAWAFRHFPVHKNSVKEAEALECAAELGGNEGFWRYTDKIFEVTPSNDGLDLSLLPKIAKEVGLNEIAFAECINSGKYEEKILKQRDEAVAAGAEGTPYSVIFTRGQRIPLNQGALPYADMKNIIDAILNE